MRNAIKEKESNPQSGLLSNEAILKMLYCKTNLKKNNYFLVF